MAPISKIQKRDGRIVKFDQEKITEAIWKAAQSVGGKDHQLAEKISAQVTSLLEVFFKDGDGTPTVEQIQDLVEKILIEDGHAKTAKAFILYRQKQKELRQQKASLLGQESDTKFSLNAIKVLQKRYLLKGEDGNIVETPEQLFERVAKNIAEADKVYKDFDAEKSRTEFYDAMIGKKFIPNSPTLMNAGTPMQQLAACFVLPVRDSIPEIFETLKQTAIIQQTGGGTGFNFSRLRPRGDYVHTTNGQSSGPVSFMKIFDTLTHSMKEGGKRRGANMGILNVDHPDILEFITCKEKEGELANFNLSIGITDKFMKAVEDKQDYDLVNPRTGKSVNTLNAESVLELIATKAWGNGEPGVVFIDRLEAANPTPEIGSIDATNPCGEQPLLPYEACNLGSVNVAAFTKANDIDWDELKKTIHLAIHFLDNVIDMSDYKVEAVKKIVLANRKVGLGVMGFADLLFKLRIPYNSEEAEKTADKLMSFFQKEAKAASVALAKTRGSFPNFEKSLYPKLGYKTMRNATVTTIAPAGTLSIIADTSSGIEPLYGLVFLKQVLDGTELLYVNKTFEKELEKAGIESNELMRRISKTGSVQEIHEIPAELKKIFVIAGDISPFWHIRMQAAFQRHTDNAVSKTINLPGDATVEEVKNAFIMAYQLGCKGLTIYREESRKKQILNKLKKNVDIQSQLPFNSETKDNKKSMNKRTEEVIPPPVTNH